MLAYQRVGAGVAPAQRRSPRTPDLIKKLPRWWHCAGVLQCIEMYGFYRYARMQSCRPGRQKRSMIVELSGLRDGHDREVCSRLIIQTSVAHFFTRLPDERGYQLAQEDIRASRVDPWNIPRHRWTMTQTTLSISRAHEMKELMKRTTKVLDSKVTCNHNKYCLSNPRCHYVWHDDIVWSLRVISSVKSVSSKRRSRNARTRSQGSCSRNACRSLSSWRTSGTQACWTGKNPHASSWKCFFCDLVTRKLRERVPFFLTTW